MGIEVEEEVGHGHALIKRSRAHGNFLLQPHIAHSLSTLDHTAGFQPSITAVLSITARTGLITRNKQLSGALDRPRPASISHVQRGMKYGCKSLYEASLKASSSAS